MMLPEHEWLDTAKRLAIGQKVRTKHRNERRQNLIIANEADRYWCYCQRCHEGGVVLKEHVLLREPSQVGQDTCVLPDDMVLVYGSDYEVEVARFLASKNMAYTYITHSLYVSPKAKRLLVRAGGWHGRDLTGKSAYKWMNYNQTQVTSIATPHPVLNGGALPVVVVEDLFSMFKVAWACRTVPMRVVCALGTDIKDALVTTIGYPPVLIWFFDNDPAGLSGANNGVRRLRPFVSRQQIVLPPSGLDPKDMQCTEILNLVRGAL